MTPVDYDIRRASSSTSAERQRKGICSICAKPSEKIFCDACADRVRAEALAKKKWEDKGKA